MTMGNSIRCGALGLGLAALLLGTPAHAAFSVITQPGAAYTGGTTRIDFADPDFSSLTSLSDGTETVNFDIGMIALTVPTTWSTWGAPPNTESSAPRVLWSDGFTDLTMDLIGPVATFGFEAQPNTSVPGSFVASFFHGINLLGSVALTVDGNAGARLFAATDTTDVFDRIVFSGSDDFAIANVRYAAIAQVPEPNAALPVALGGTALMLLRRRERRV